METKILQMITDYQIVSRVKGVFFITILFVSFLVDDWRSNTARRTTFDSRRPDTLISITSESCCHNEQVLSLPNGIRLERFVFVF